MLRLSFVLPKDKEEFRPGSEHVKTLLCIASVIMLRLSLVLPREKQEFRPGSEHVMTLLCVA